MSLIPLLQVSIVAVEALKKNKSRTLPPVAGITATSWDKGLHYITMPTITPNISPRSTVTVKY